MKPVRLSPEPRARRPLRRLVHTLLPPSTLDFWAARLHPTWSWTRPLARVVGRIEESRDAVTLLLQPNRRWRGGRPGQHVNVTAELDGRRITRSYSLSDAGRGDRRIAITVKAIDGGKLSRHLCRAAVLGEVLELGPAFGELAVPAASQERWLFLAAGSGITPLIAMTRALAAQGMPVALTLVYWARRRDELCFVDELRQLAARHADFRVHFVLTREAPAAADERAGRLDAAQLAALVPDASERHVRACGPGGFVAGARALLGAQAPSFLAESFTPPPRVIAEGGTVEVTLAMTGRTLSVPRGQSLLSALEDAGLKPAAGCRMGICNTCACGKRAGSSRHLHTGALDHEPASALRICVSSAATDLVLDL
jgi:ferredoxin-NADP reductase